MTRVHLSIVVTSLAAALSACANLPAIPVANHAPINQDAALTSVGGQTRTITVAIPYRSECAIYPSYTATYVRSFVMGYVGEWNTKVGALESMEANATKKKAYRNSWLKAPDQLVETGSPGLQESNCLGNADLADEEGRTKAHNDLLSNHPVP